MTLMPENDFNHDLLEQAAAEYSSLLEHEINNAEQEAEALEVEIPDRLTGRLSRKYGLRLKKSERHEKRVLNAALAVIAVFCIAVWFPKTVTAVVNVIRELAFEDHGKSMDVYSKTKADSAFYIDIPEEFLSEGTFLVGKDIIKTRYQSPENYIEVTEYPDDYKIVYDTENPENRRDIELNAHFGKIFRKNGITTIVLDYSGTILEVESSLQEDALLEIANSIKSINE